MSAGGSERGWGAALVERLGGSPRGSVAALVGLCLVVFLPGFFTIPPVDRDESRFAQASRQMFESAALPEAERDPAKHGGGWAVPMVQDRPRLNKPPLIYWLQAGSAWALTGGDPLRDAIWMYRVPSLVAGIAAVLGTWWIGRSMFDGRVGALAAALLAVCPVVAWEAHQARADMVLLACTVVALGAVWEVWKGEAASRGGGKAAGRAEQRHEIRGTRRRVRFVRPLVLWGAVALGVMVKGPVTPMVAGLAVLGLCVATRRWGWVGRLRPVLGVAIVAGVVAPWVWAVASRVGWGEYVRVVVDETLGRSLIAKEGHWGPPGYHLVLLPVLFWPGSLLTAAGLVEAWRRVFGRSMSRHGEEGATGGESGGPVRARPRLLAWWTERAEAWTAEPALVFCLAWIAPSWIVLELVGTKLPHYTMVLYPAVAVVSAWAVVRSADAIAAGDATRPDGFGLNLWSAIGLVAALAVAALPALPVLVTLVYSVQDGAFAAVPLWFVRQLVVLVLAGVGLGLVVWAFRWVRAGRIIAGQTAALGAMAAMLVSFLSGPGRNALPGSNTPLLARGIRQIDGWERTPIASTYHEDSLIYHLRGRLERIETGEAGAWLAAHPDGICVVPAAFVAHHRDEYQVVGQLRREDWPMLPTHYAVRRRAESEQTP